MTEGQDTDMLSEEDQAKELSSSELRQTGSGILDRPDLKDRIPKERAGHDHVVQKVAVAPTKTLGKKKLHWYTICFNEIRPDSEGNGSVHIASAYIAVSVKAVKKCSIESAKVTANLSSQAVPTSVSYLGCMTEKEFLS